MAVVKPGYMLEHPCIRRYSFLSHPSGRCGGMSSDNPHGADNQQETKGPEGRLDPWWVVGFVDGEGCFPVALHRNTKYARSTGGWQLTPVFQVYQHEKGRELLERVRAFFGVGKVVPKGPRSSVLTYSVGALPTLEQHILPFFERYRPLVKGPDFDTFAEIVRSMRAKEHLTREGFDRLVRLAYAMNAHGKAALTADRNHPAGILRDCTPGAAMSSWRWDSPIPVATRGIRQKWPDRSATVE